MACVKDRSTSTAFNTGAGWLASNIIICMHIDRAGEICIILDFVFEVCACVIRNRGQGRRRKERVEGIARLIKRTERVGRGKIHNFWGRDIPLTRACVKTDLQVLEAGLRVSELSCHTLRLAAKLLLQRGEALRYCNWLVDVGHGKALPFWASALALTAPQIREFE